MCFESGIAGELRSPSGRNVMRTIVLAITTVMTVSVATAVLTAGVATPVFAQTAQTKTVKQKMADMKAKDGKSYAECLTLATQRGFARDPESNSDAMMFVDGCMAGKQR
jgi:hypothetical protein